MINETLEQIQIEIQQRSGVENISTMNELGQDIFNSDLDFQALQNLGQKLIRNYFYESWKKEMNKEDVRIDVCPFLDDEVIRMPVTNVPEIMSKTASEEPSSNTTGIKIKNRV